MNAQKSAFAVFACALALVAAVALPGDAGAQSAPCCLRGTSMALNQVNNVGKDADEKFFTVAGAPPNLMFLLDTSCSMRDLPIDPNSGSTRAQGTGCANTIFDGIATAKAFNQAAPLGTYPPVDLGVAPCPGVDCWNGDPGWPDLFQEDKFYRNRSWGIGTATAIVDAATACSGSATAAACVTCLNTKGYYFDPGSSSDFRTLFSGKYLNMYPPKYVAARTVLKNVLWDVKRVRMGLTIFDSTNTGGNLVSAMNPPCDQALDTDPTSLAWTNNRKSLVNTIAGINPFSGNTPLAEALFNVGQYFTTDDSVFDGWFGNAAWRKNSFANGSLTGQNRSVCQGCQVNSVIVVTDGAPCSDNCVPQCIRLQDPTCPGCDATDCGCNGTCPWKCGGASCASPGGSSCCGSGGNMLDGVAKWFYTHDLQTKNPGNSSWSADGPQRLVTYTVGFGLDTPLLQNTAVAGGGQYYTANDKDTLEAAILSVITDVNKRATTFGVSSISTLQTSSGMATIVPRFVPGKPGEEWKGFLYRFGMKSERLNGCKETSAPNPPDVNDLDGDRKCDTLFYVDRDGALAEEDPVTGVFIKKGSGAVPARPFWEAGRELTYANPTYSEPETAPLANPDNRSIWTLTDSNNDGRFDRTDTLLEFTEANVDALMPYMNISVDASKDPVCQALYTNMGIAAPAIDSWGTECAKVIINFYRGRMANDPDPAKRTNTRPWLLADIFHSSPVVVEPPIAEEGCPFYTGQCLASIFSYEGKVHPASRAAYESYVKDANGACGNIPCERRKAIVLVGSNGGFLHAFDSGDLNLPEAREPLTNRLKYTNGTGKELWAFVPPDLLGSLKFYMGSHGYFVDGAPMVRDIWVDAPELTTGDGVKAAGEFHTVAIVGERNGGQFFFALDLTKNLNELVTKKPQFLWMWPPPCSQRATQVGETWSNFFPKPPPIGPVLLDATKGAAAGAKGFKFKFRRWNQGTGAWDDQEKDAAERWVVMLNGGYDRAFVRGRGFSMIDAYTGRALWEEYFAPGGDPPNRMLEYPISAGVAMVDIGPGEMKSYGFHDAYFDTATFGDLGGSLWTARFYEPGVLDGPGGTASNWEFGRGFQTERADGTTVRDRRGISFITSNALHKTQGYLRTFFGSGDRNALLDSGGGVCSLDNVGTCIAMGCKVEGKYTATNVAGGALELKTKWESARLTEKKFAVSQCTDHECKEDWFDGCDDNCGSTTCNGSAPCPTCLGEDACKDAVDQADAPLGCRVPCAAACDQVKLELRSKVKDCPGGIVETPGDLERNVTVQCAKVGPALECKRNVGHNDTGIVTYKPTALATLAKHRYYSVHTFGEGVPKRVFSDPTGAIAYDGIRLTETDLTDLGSLSAPSGSGAPDDGEGWYITYDSVDERTASAAGIDLSQDRTSSCVVWNTLTPSASGTVCAGSGNQEARLVQANTISGLATCADSFDFSDGGSTRFEVRTVLVPPPEPTKVMMVGEDGQIMYGFVTAEPGRNAKFSSMSQETDVFQSVYGLELSQSEHVCRHRTTTPPGAACGH